MKYGQVMRRARNAAGKTQSFVANILDCSIVDISRTERSENPPWGIDETFRVLEALGQTSFMEEAVGASCEYGGEIRFSLRGESEPVTTMLRKLALEHAMYGLSDDLARKISGELQ